MFLSISTSIDNFQHFPFLHFLETFHVWKCLSFRLILSSNISIFQDENTMDPKSPFTREVMLHTTGGFQCDIEKATKT
jgi:hypothetical protein